jgi:hypothetical protein
MTALILRFPVLDERDGRQFRARRSPRLGSDAPRRRHLVSNRAFDWAWTQPVRGTRQHVLLALAKRARPKSEQAAPSMPELVEMTGLSENTIRGHIQALAEAGIIRAVVSNGGRHKRSTYTLMVNALPVSGSPTPQEMRGNETPETPQEMHPSIPETPQLLSENPSGDAPVVLRTKSGTRGVRETTGAAAASHGVDKHDGLFVEPPRIVTTEVINASHAVAAWNEGYSETHSGKPTTRAIGQVGRESRQLLEAENPPDLVLAAARSAGARGFATVEREFHAMTAVVPAPSRHLASAQPQQQGTARKRANAFLDRRRGTPA